MATSAPGEWTCPTCSAVVTTPYCPECGERPLQARDLTLRGLFDRAFHAVTNVDGRLPRTAWCLLRWPGALTVAFVTGKRKPYIAPFQLFLLANVLFFAVQSISQTNVFGSQLDSHLQVQDWKETARALTDARLEQKHLALAQYEPVFNRAVAQNAKTLIFLMTIPFALLLAVLFHKRERPFAVHAVLSLHVWSFLLIVFSFSLVAADTNLLLGGAGLRSAGLDNVLSAINLVACATYMFLAVNPVYGSRGVARIVKALVLTLSMGTIVLGYRFFLFPITLYATT
jgi:hypothetical protein